MPLLGGIEIRERRPRYHGEPRYKRLDFVRPKKMHYANPDEWDLVRRVQHFEPSRPVDIVWAQPRHHHPQQLPPQIHQQMPQFPAGHHHQIPPPPLPPHHHGGHGYEPHTHHNEVIDLGPVPSGDYDDDGDGVIYQVIEPKRLRSRSQSRSVILIPNNSEHPRRSKSKHKKPRGESLYGSDSDDDDRRGRSRGRGRSRSRLKLKYDSDNDSLLEHLGLRRHR